MTEPTHQARYDDLRRMVEKRIRALPRGGSAEDLNDACRYVLGGGGKRVRAVLVLLSCEAVGGKAKQALDPSVALELMHNFTLVHDDIMDHAPSRRGRPTVHIRWTLNNALLAGDVLLAMAYAALLRTRTPEISPALKLFTNALLQVCEGQALDLGFEKKADVSVRDYFRMIGKKTGRLFSAAGEIGGLFGGGSQRQIGALSEFGHHLGRAFQLQDDLLDVMADQSHLGKSIGGDILERKKTYLLLRAAERARGRDRVVVQALLRGRRTRPDGSDGMTRRSGRPADAHMISMVTDIYRRYGILEDTQRQVRANTRKAVNALHALPRNEPTATLRWLSESLVKRAS
jgi:geranylgeranyl diphosphate synthase type II